MDPSLEARIRLSLPHDGPAQRLHPSGTAAPVVTARLGSAAANPVATRWTSIGGIGLAMYLGILAGIIAMAWALEGFE